MRSCPVPIAAGLALAVATPLHAEVFEVTRDRADELPMGKEADGIPGDFILRNDTVEAVISGNAPLRRANMSTFYGADGITPGCLYDLTLRGSDNDQITVFSPLGQQGAVSWVRAIPEPEVPGGGSVEVVVTAAKGDGLSKLHRYRLEEGVAGVFIDSEVVNEGSEPVTFPVRDRWTGLGRADFRQGISWGDAIDPDDRAGYAFGWLVDPPPGEVTLQPGDRLAVTRLLAVADSPAAAYSIVASEFEAGRVSGKVTGPDGEPVAGATVSVQFPDSESNQSIPAYTRADGTYDLRLPPGVYRLECTQAGRGAVAAEVESVIAGEASQDFELGPQSAVVFEVRGEGGGLLPCKVQFAGVGETPTPNLGPDNRASGCRDQWHSATGEFRVPLAPGTYQITVTRGPEFSHHVEEVVVNPGEDSEVSCELEHLVDSSGWVSTDFHNHSTPSGDNTCGTPDRITNLVAEHIEFAPTTEHNRLFDWTPVIYELGVGKFLSTVPGMELTGSGAHLNTFPVKPEPLLQDGGAPVWEKDPRVSALHLREMQGGDPDRWVHVNHPDMVENFVDRDGDGKTDGGFVLLGEMLDGLETQNYLTDFAGGEGILATAPYRLVGPLDQGPRVRFVREFIWLQLLNQGVKVKAIAVADAHSVYGNGVGGWRTYIPSGTDNPDEIDWREISRNAKAGRLMLTTGPFLEVSADGAGPGDTVEPDRQAVPVHIRVQCNSWVDIDRVQVLVNGRQREDLNFTRASHPAWFHDGETLRFDQTVNVDLTEDSHLIVVAQGEGSNLATGFGTSPQAAMQPCAYHNPIWVDWDGGGFEPNGDTLGFPLPVAGLTPDHVRTLLQR